MQYIIVVEPPPKKHQSTQDAYDVAAYIANKYVERLYDRGRFNSLTPTKSICNSIRKRGVTLLYKTYQADMVLDDYKMIKEWIDNAGNYYQVTAYELEDVGL